MVEVSCSSQLYPKPFFEMKENILLGQSNHLALILGSALKSVFPKVELIEYASSDGVLYYECVLPHPLNNELLSILQEEMLNLLDRALKPYPLEMIPKNAVELFKHHRQALRAKIYSKDQEILLPLVKLGEHYDLAFDTIDPVFEGVFKLTHFEEGFLHVQGEEYPTTRIFASVACDKPALKKKLLTQKEIQKQNHVKLSQRLNLFFESENGWIFHPRGLSALNQLKRQFELCFEQFGFKEVSFNPYTEASFYDLFLSIEREGEIAHRFYTSTQSFSTEYSPFHYGLYNLEQESESQFKILTSRSKEVTQECIYCLKFYLEIIKILGFSYEFDFHPQNEAFSLEKIGAGQKLDTWTCSVGSHFLFKLTDHWGRNLLNLELKVKSFQKEVLIEGKIPSLEKLFAWMLEDRSGQLPGDFCPKELYIVSMKGTEDYAQEVYNYFKKNKIDVILDEVDGNLNQKLSEVLKKREPYIALLGIKEKTENKVTLKKPDSHQQELVTKEELLQVLRT